jgi:formate C-acetyltransferase
MNKLSHIPFVTESLSRLSFNEVFNNSLRKPLLNPATHILLQTLALQFSLRPSLKKYLKGMDGWINFTIGFKTHSGSVHQAISFQNGKVNVLKTIPEQADLVLTFSSDEALIDLFRLPPNEALNLVLKNRIVLEGNLAYLQAFNFYVSLLMGNKHQKMLEKAQQEDQQLRQDTYSQENPSLSEEFEARPHYRMRYPDAGFHKNKPDQGVHFLEDPYLPEYTLESFPRLQGFLDDHLSHKAEVCAERAKLLTQYYRKHGFEHCFDQSPDGKQLSPQVRQARAFKYLMAHKKPIIRNNDLLAGTSSSNPIAGSVVYPDAQGVMIWGELLSIDKRSLIPFAISQETINTLHFDVFPFWAKRNFNEWMRVENDYPVCQKINERWVAYFVWKSLGISHTIPDFPRLLEKGTLGIIKDIEIRLGTEASLLQSEKEALQAMSICLEGINIYAQNLASESEALAQEATSPQQKHERLRLAEICRKVPMQPPETLDEAFNAIWITWVGLLNENADTGLSVGRLDQWLQPFFERDLKKCTTKKSRKAYIAHALELAGCFFMRCTDHFPLGPDIANFLFGGASSTQALTLGGVTPEGDDAVNDMTYIFLKVTEMLSIRDVNVNARFKKGVNSDAYLDRLCEVNFITAGTPSMHNDDAVFASLKPHAYPMNLIRDWSATGCVEPTLSGKHMAHTGSILMNLVAGMEMALNDGYHPLMNWHLGPKTGSVKSFDSFDDFFNAYMEQQTFLIDQAVELNNALAKIHAQYRPTPLLSALMDGAIQNAKDVTQGGALYNSSGVSNIGLADVTDSLLVIKKLVFDDKRFTFVELKQALDNDFKDNPALRALVQNKVPLFGSGDPDAVAMANRVAGAFHRYYNSCRNYRNGPYTAGFWSMSQHVAYGSLSGALPSGRLAGKAFTPGLTPQPSASKNFLDNICDVAKLNPEFMDNNIAFNVKLIPDSKDTREETVNIMSAYVKTYFDHGGMQLQFNVVTSETLRDAMAHPENYRNLLVRISGYNAYFVTLNKEIQIELIERTEYGL